MAIKIVALIQCRLSSKRFPRKGMAKLAGQPVIEWVMNAALSSKQTDSTALTTSDGNDDNELERFAHEKGWLCYRGPLRNVLKRMYSAAMEYEADALVRLSGDSPLLDTNVIDQGVKLFRANNYDIVTNTFPRTCPHGQSVEIISRQAMEIALREVSKQSDKEHVTPYFYRTEKFRIKNYSSERYKNDKRNYCVDYESDIKVLEEKFLGFK